jgi:hypothetical protein
VARHHHVRRLVPLVVTGLLLAACGQQQPGETPAAAGEVTELAHVHGLGVDPADGALYAASHHGVFRVPEDGEPVKVSETQDTMGFTVVGPGHFLGSGHPSPEDTERPPHLGLIESTDAGRTWATLSLSGEVDFHALEAKHDLVYGFDSQTQQVMVSTDRKTWDRRARLSLADFAVDPADPDTLLATTEQGLARSSDGGRTFTPVPNAPTLLLVDWPAESTLVAVSPDGTIQRSSDSGATWTSGGSAPGAPEALATRGTSEIYVATDRGIHRSADGGGSFTSVDG